MVQKTCLDKQGCVLVRHFEFEVWVVITNGFNLVFLKNTWIYSEVTNCSEWIRAVFGVSNVPDWLETHASLLFTCLFAVKEEFHTAIPFGVWLEFAQIIANYDDIVPAFRLIFQVNLCRDCFASFFINDLETAERFVNLNVCTSAIDVLD